MPLIEPSTPGAARPGAAVRRIIAALDLAPAGETALPVAEAFARAHGAELILLHVLPRARRDAGGVSPEEERARAYLETLAAPLHAAGVPTHGLVRVGADLAGAIVAAAHAQRADLIVLGSERRGGLARAVRGSVADRVARGASVPVMLVRPDPVAGADAPVRSFDADAGRRGPLARWPLGPRTVAVARIVGSVGRAAELGASFRPARPSPEDDERYARVRRGLRAGAALPPVALNKLGSAYYVVDGNHRVAAAKELGQLEIDADVTEFVALDDAEAQRAFVERRGFERETGLTGIVAAHAPGTWTRLRAMVERFVATAGLSDRRQAARRWYDGVYRPMAARVQALDLTSRVPGAHPPDLVAMVDAFRECAQRALGRELDWAEAVDRFAERGSETG